MSLNDSNMNIEIGVSNKLIEQGIRNQVYNNVAFACSLPNLLGINANGQDLVIHPNRGVFIRNIRGGVSQVEFRMYFTSNFLPSLSIDIPVQITSQGTNIVLTLDLPNAIATGMNLQFGLNAIPVTLPLGNFLTNNMAIVGQVEVILGAEILLNGIMPTREFSTMAMGVEINTGSNVDRNHFNNDYTPRRFELPNNSNAYMLIERDIMEQVILAQVQPALASEIPFESEITDINVFWMSEDIDIYDTTGIYDREKLNHPIWVTVKGEAILPVFDVPFYAYSFSDFVVGDNITLETTIFAAGSPFLVLTAELRGMEIEPIVISPANIANNTQISGMTGSVDGLRIDILRTPNAIVNGVPEISVSNTEVLMRGGWQHNSNLGPSNCRDSWDFIGSFDANRNMVSRIQITNNGLAPLWICDIAVDNAAQAFLDLDFNAVPFTINAGENTEVVLRVDTNDSHRLSTFLTISCNDMESPEVRIPITVDYAAFTPDFSGEEVCAILYSPPDNMADIIKQLVIIDILDTLDKKLPEIGGEVPSCPRCGYYADITISGVNNREYDQYRNFTQSFSRVEKYQDVVRMSLPIGDKAVKEFDLMIDDLNNPVSIKLSISEVQRISQIKFDTEVVEVKAVGQYLLINKRDTVDINKLDERGELVFISSFIVDDVTIQSTFGNKFITVSNENTAIYDISDPYNVCLTYKNSSMQKDNVEINGRRLIHSLDKCQREYTLWGERSLVELACTRDPGDGKIVFSGQDQEFNQVGEIMFQYDKKSSTLSFYRHSQTHIPINSEIFESVFASKNIVDDTGKCSDSLEIETEKLI